MNNIETIALRYALTPQEVEKFLPLSHEYNLHIYDIKSLYDTYEKDIHVVEHIKEKQFGNKLEKWLKGDYKLVNTSNFTESAKHFKDYKQYTNALKNSHPASAYMKYWFEEARRSIYGYYVDKEWISGYNYFYLNYTPIELTEIIDNDNNKTYVRAERIVDFPKFWDGDFFYFHYLEEAERNGLSAVVLKTRGRGFSWKAASMPNRNFFLIPRSRSVIYASSNEYLIGDDGVLGKCWSQMSFIDDHTAWTKKKQKKDTETHKRASMTKLKNGTIVEEGFLSEIAGVTLKDDPNKLRGKRSKLILFEEAGSFNNLLQSWIIAEPSIKQGRAVFGLRIGFGTGGSESTSFEGLRKLFYEPNVYGVYSVNDLWTPGMSTKEVGWFHPEYINREGFYDKDGNSNLTQALEDIERERDRLVMSGSDADTILRKKAEQPIIPEEALLRTTGSPFPRNLIKEQLIRLERSEYKGEVYRGRLIFDRDGRIMWIEDKETLIIENTRASKSNRVGGIELYSKPIDAVKEHPYGYIIGVDPIDFDYSESEKYSLGSCFVFNTFTKEIVAEYTGRPDLADEFFENVRRLSIYYNALVMYENNLKGLYTYFINKLSEDKLAVKPKILDDSSMIISSGRQKYGYTASKQTISLGLQLIRKWLMTNINEDIEMTFLYTIKSKGLLNELIDWNPDGNFDRVSAMIAMMIFYQDIERLLESGINDTDKAELNKFWTRPFNNKKNNISLQKNKKHIQ